MRKLLVAVLLVALNGCGGDGPSGPDTTAPGRIEAASPLTRSGTAGVALAEALSVRVVASSGSPVPGVPVQWSVVQGGGQLGLSTTLTDSAGVSRATWTLGPAVGTNVVTAALGSLPGVTFTATGAAGPPSTLEKVSGDGQTVQIMQPLRPLVVKVTDANGNPVRGAAVQWSTGSGSRSTASDSAGLAALEFTADRLAGPGTATARLGTASVAFSYSKLSGRPVEIVQTGFVTAALAGQPLPDSLRAWAGDEQGNGVAGVTVRFTATAGGGTISPATALTDSRGYATALWTLGPAPGSPQVATARADGLPTVGSWTADALAPGVDVTPPTLESFRFVRDSVNLRGGGDTIVIALRVSDYQSGVASAGLLAISPFGSRRGASEVGISYVNHTDHYLDLELRIAARDADWGRWSVGEIWLRDRAGNTLRMTSFDLAARGYPTSFVITGK